MDDPWGSPWADESPNAISKPQSIAKPISPVKVSSIGESINSPWNDDEDGFGDWTVASEPAVSNAIESRSDFGHEFDAVKDNEEALESKAHIEQPLPTWGHESPLPVEANLDLTPISTIELKQNAQPRSSPDPWSLDRESDPSVPSFKLHTVEVQSPSAKDSSTEKIDKSSKIEEQSPDLGTKLVDPVNVAASTGNGGEDHPSVQLLAVPEGGGKSDIDSPGSTSPESHADDIELPESPQTSFDEPGEQHRVKRVPSKVKVLIEHFDGLAQADSPTPVSSQALADTWVTDELEVSGSGEIDGDEDGDDFGDFEEGMSESGDAFNENAEGADMPTSKAVTMEQSARGHDALPSPERHLPVQFDVDTTILERLFPALGATDSPSASKSSGVSPDTILQDNFSTTEERKTWYRISRYDTMRKYNSGADENYTRVDWSHSLIRKETLKIVARWMEEDRIGGRVTLGGSSKGGAIFGWDSKKAPVPISTALATKRDAENNDIRSRPDLKAKETYTELPDAESKLQSTSEQHRKSSLPSPGGPKARTLEAVAQFGWNMVESPAPSSSERKPASRDSSEHNISAVTGNTLPSEVASPPAENPAEKSNAAVFGLTVDIPVATAPLPSRPMESARAFSPITPVTIPPSLPPPEDPEEDDWGEMVSSPIVSQPPTSLPQTSPHYERSMSIGGLGSDNPQIPSQRPVDVIKRGHKATASLNNIFVPIGQATMFDHSKPPLTAGITGSGFPDFFSSTTPSTSQNPPTTTTTGAFDPWASADFSIFEKPSKQPPKPESPLVTKPIIRSVPNHSRRPQSFAAPATPSPLRNQRSREEVEHEEIYKRIIAGLPNLSYMMRR